MPRTSPSNASPSVDAPPAPTSLPWGVIVAVLCGLAAAWIASGSAGLLGHPLRRGLALAALAAAALGATAARRSWRAGLAAAIGFLAAAVMLGAAAQPINVLAAAVLLGVLAVACDRTDRRALLLVSFAVAVLGIWRFACTSVPTLWTAADRLAAGIGWLGGSIVGRPLWLGATFAGIDYLVVMVALLAAWLVMGPPPRLGRGLYAAVAIGVGHLAYIVVLTWGDDLAALFPEPEPVNDPRDYEWTWSAALRTLFPWNLPALAGLIHLTIAGLMLRWTPPSVPAGAPRAGNRDPGLAGYPRPLVAGVGAAVLAAALPVVTCLSLSPLSLQGKKIVAFEKGFLNWNKPEHGQYGRLSVGMYGMMPAFVESLGGRFVISPDLSAEDLDGADALVLLFPNEPWPAGVLERIWGFVRDGGTLIVFGEHTTKDKQTGESFFNEVLAPTAMRVRFDSATFAVGGWLQSYQTLGHPTTAGIADDRNAFGVVIGASVEARWPARPMLVGRWGWNDPGDEGGPAMMGNHRYDDGEKLGDLVLAAEQPFGRGRVIAFGDTSGVTNGITVGSHVFTSRLFAYLAGPPAASQTLVRQGMGLVLAAALLALLAWGADPRPILAAAVALSLSWSLCTAATHRAAEVLPDGRLKQPNNLAYVDGSHMEAYDDESWRRNGVGGLNLTLMRNGYLTLDLPEFTAERLQRAGLLVSVAPRRAFTPAERRVLRGWVREGGLFICMVGYDDRRGSESVLADFGFRIGYPPRPDGSLVEPQPMGHFKSPYFVAAQGTDRQQAFVRFHAGWPVTCSGPVRGGAPGPATSPEDDEQDIHAVAYGRGRLRDGLPEPLSPEPGTSDRTLSVIVRREVGEGHVVVIGDTGFAMNKNLENEGGQPFEGKRENADFWRWLLSRLRDGPTWEPIPATQPGAMPGGQRP